jgi:prepilin-type processing-associated H-X9-DG protein
MLHDLLQRVADSPPFDPAATPETVALAADRRWLRLTWPSGEQAEIPAERLRAGCRCAWCTRARIDGIFPPSFNSVAVDRLVPVGGYALNIAFSDGHARGIYPWPYLRAIANGVAERGPSIASGMSTATQALEQA